MKTSFTDAQGIKYDFEFDGVDVVVSCNAKMMAMPIEQVVNNSGPWQFTKNNYLKMAPDAIVFIEKFCKNKAFW